MFHKAFLHKKTFLIAAACLLLIGSVAIYAFARAAASEGTSKGEGTEIASSFPSTGQKPFYKLQENIREYCRPEWVWDEEKQEYSNLGDLVRDPETGLFPEPSLFPKGLVGRATWDPYLGLYVINTTHINHETGEITYDPFVWYWTGYYNTNRKDHDIFDDGYEKYVNYTNEKYYKGGFASFRYPEMEVFERDALTPEWFGLTTNDLPMLMDKLEVGAPPTYTMSLIMLITKTDVGIRPSSDTDLVGWLTAFNALTSGAREQVKQGNLKGLGYLALPFLYDELLSGSDSLLAALPDQSNGLNGAAKADTASWNKEDWLAWFKDNAESMEIFRYVCQRTINMPWLGYDN